MSERVGPSTAVAEEDAATREFEQLLGEPIKARLKRERIDGVLVGSLIGFRDAYEPLVMYPGQAGPAALAARSTIDLLGEHVGQQVTLVFEDGDPEKPIVIGRIRVPSGWPAAERPVDVDVDADGKRVILTAREQLVLRCGKASITLTAAGKVLIEGAYVSNRSSGAIRMKAGSIRLN